MTTNQIKMRLSFETLAQADTAFRLARKFADTEPDKESGIRNCTLWRVGLGTMSEVWITYWTRKREVVAQFNYTTETQAKP